MQDEQNKFICRLQAAQEEIKCLRSQLERAQIAATLDNLTQVFNRNAFTRLLEQMLREGHQGIALIMLDIDYFKPYNDALGHLAGDDALRKVSAALRESLQREGDTACRYGGEEFAIILANTHQEGAEQVAARIHAAVASLDIKHPSSPLGRLTLSIGITVVDPVIDEQPGELLAQADQALYRAKHEGRNRTCLWQPPVLDLHQAT